MAVKKRILFAGYAPVHFLCFLPVYQQLKRDPGLSIWFTGGFRHKSGDGAVTYSIEGFYDAHPVPADHVITIDEARQQDFDVLVCSHLSDDLFPRMVKKTVQIFHGVSFKNYAVREKALRFDFLCLPGAYHARRYQEHGLLREDGPDVFLTGFAKCDPLVQGSLNRHALLERLGMDSALPTILYAPTGDKNNSLETIGEDVISRLAATSEYNVLVKPHNHPKRKIKNKRIADMECATMRLVRDLDVVPYLHAADVLISDASSVVTEFTLLDRPIVLLDVPKLFERVVERGGALDLVTYGHRLGPVVADPASICDVVHQQLADNSAYGPVRRAMAKDVFHDPGTAARRVADVVRFAAGILQTLPGDILPAGLGAVAHDPNAVAHAA